MDDDERRERLREDLTPEQTDALLKIAEIVERDLVPLLAKLPKDHGYRRFGAAGLSAHRELLKRYGAAAFVPLGAVLALGADEGVIEAVGLLF